MSYGLKHYGTYRQREIIILGYNVAVNQVMICDINTLTMNDQRNLRLIAGSVTAQNQDVLIPLLQKERHESNTDWFTYLAKMLKANRGQVVTIPLKEIQFENETQAGVFKGYIKSSNNASTRSSDFGNNIPDFEKDNIVEDFGSKVPFTDTKPSSDLEIKNLSNKIDNMTSVLVQELRALRSTLAPAATPVVKPKRTRKPRTVSTKE